MPTVSASSVESPSRGADSESYEQRLWALIEELETRATQLEERASTAGAFEALRADLHRENASRLRAMGEQLRSELHLPVAAHALTRSQ